MANEINVARFENGSDLGAVECVHRRDLPPLCALVADASVDRAVPHELDNIWAGETCPSGTARDFYVGCSLVLPMQWSPMAGSRYGDCTKWLSTCPLFKLRPGTYCSMWIAVMWRHHCAHPQRDIEVISGEGEARSYV